MKIAINKNSINNEKVKKELESLKNQGFEVEEFEINDIKDIILYTKKNNINVYIDLPERLNDIVKNSISISTSTYLMDSKDDIYEKINKISKNRKPSVEKIWNRNYTDDQLNMEFPRMTQTDYVRAHNINPNYTALNYYGVKTTYNEYEKELNLFVSKIASLGVKPGDFISFCMPNTPELVKIRYALEDMGVVANFIDPRVDSQTLLHCLKTGNSKIAFILDSKYKELEKIIDKTSLNKVFLLTPFESIKKLNSPYNFIQKVKGNRPNDSGYGYYKDFENLPVSAFEKPEYSHGRLSEIQYTSGTTGKPKPVEISGDSYNDRVHQYHFTDIDLSQKNRLLQALPISGLAFGAFSMQMGLCNGMENVIVPTFTPAGLPKIIEKNDINAMVMPPLAWYGIIDSPKFNKLDLSRLTMCAVGGEGMTMSKVNETNDKLAKQGCPRHIIIGGGCTEGVVSHCTETDKLTKPGTVGIPLIGNGVTVLDKDGKELSYDQRGTICYKTVDPMIGYHDLPELTKKVKTTNGINLNDYGSVDEDGYIKILCREKDLINMKDGKIICPRDIEESIMKLEGVNFCTVVESKQEEKIRIFFTLENDANFDIVHNLIKEELSNYYQPILNLCNLIPLNNMPYTKNCKTDRTKLSQNLDDLDLCKVMKKTKRLRK